ncbi:RNA 2',3'-cyclic phosphodiesterase [Candidatus Dependentiae bacterium]|nr:RNA 2',3'-cyclic phosphodiesterase [Candidatus Dependentiae bacterium]
MVKLFVSIELPDFIKNELITIQKKLKRLDLFEGSYIVPENLHCTVFFIGIVAEDDLTALEKKLTVFSFSAFQAHLGTVGLNSVERPHVLWVTVPTSLLTVLAQQIEQQLPEYRQERVFTGHITIGRIKKVIQRTALYEFINSFTISPLKWDVEALYLQESKTDQLGSQYFTRSIITLSAD